MVAGVCASPCNSQLQPSLSDNTGPCCCVYMCLVLLLLLASSLQLNTTTPVASSASLFRDGHIADLFFRTTSCLRADQSTCWGPSE